jgi:PAS domain S-box-containing protein
LSAGAAIAVCFATCSQAQSLAGGDAETIGFGATGGIVLVLLAWACSLGQRMRRMAARPAAAKAPGKARAESPPGAEQEFLGALLEHSPDAIYFKDRRSRFLRCSKAMCDRLGVAPEEMVGKTDFDFFDEGHAREAFEDEQEILRTGQALQGKVERELWNKEAEKWALTAKMPLRNKDGEIIGTFGISKDMTFLKQAEAKLESTHKQLVEASRQAGMAEVATTVLHNVGNVLNSVNISAAVVSERVRNSKAANLGRAAELLKEHAKDLPRFLSEDSKGRKLPEYFASLADCLAAEQREMLRELSALCANIEHINEIVTMQQNYARVAGVLETFQASDLVEDALRLNAGAVERHHVQVIRQFLPAPPVLVDKHKVLQILVNLIRNAKYALDDRGHSDKQLTLGVGPGQGGSVKISIIDNGIGITPENLRRIFEHGFTTRAKGHGFALHSGALTARQMGGSLTCHSDGPNQGATFTLELPPHPPEAAP